MQRANSSSQVCPLCHRSTHLTFHHFIPRKVHRRAHFKKHFSKASLQQGVKICRQCHNGIHKFYDEMTLAKRFSTLQLLRDDQQLSRYFSWVGRQKIQ